ncbi:Extracellular exo-alpha-(1-_5)-L-arabinofuranosidase precursor [Sedimentisphaera cyanobacteriorum]|uniref:Extracellular exo-alpha-(1->5)-L-arabinofuranosidase n=1 Tax=Sedimentisphaera cyanobacteriorum TaxID=1940790 RepID=A0A1Q2HSY4_9BACT|nr:family 43 glycosylhydrolase [Sedimentisphaera cyanobacteriorum]AQQ10396.1 Extracellular exo-alpha-(1->5)-L-arabinofuranosidase precursor [Sedimentisphaera cyanobacteriorum]
MKHNFLHKFAVFAFTLFISFNIFADDFRKTFVNPIYEGADPFVYKHTDGFYYFCQSEGDKGIAIWKSRKLTDKGVKRVVWKAPDTGWNTSEVWAPELHYLQGKWYIYYAADSGKNIDHRTGVLRSKTQDPQGEYEDMGVVYTGDEIETKKNNRWAIDATPLEMNGKLYLIWSGWKGYDDDIQSLYIAEMKNPWTAATNRVKMAENDTYVWERVSNDPQKKGLNEGAQILKNKDKIYVIYSCSGSWEPTYKLAQLSIKKGQDPMNPDNWKKKDKPVFQGTDEVYGTGHCCFTKSPDDTEDWMMYHSKISKRHGWQRNVRIEKFGWNPDGSPDFGKPTPPGTVLRKPSGEIMPELASHFTDSFSSGRWDNWVYYGYNRFIAVRSEKLVLGINPGWGIANNYRSGEKAVMRDMLWDDFVYYAKVKVVKGGRDAGLIFRVNHPAVGYDAMKGYFAGIIPQNNMAILGRMDGKNWQELARKKISLKQGENYHLKVMAKGEDIKFFVNNEKQIEVKDSDYSSGFAGVRVIDSEAEFDNIKIRKR